MEALQEDSDCWSHILEKMKSILKTWALHSIASQSSWPFVRSLFKKVDRLKALYITGTKKYEFPMTVSVDFIMKPSYSDQKESIYL